MNPLIPLRDAWYFFSRNLSTIALLCLPWVLLENLTFDSNDLASFGCVGNGNYQIIENCRFLRCPAYGVWAYNSPDLSIDYNEFTEVWQPVKPKFICPA